MPKTSDSWKPGFSTVAGIKAIAAGNYVDGVFNLGLALGQAGYAVGKNYIPEGKFGPRKDDGESLAKAFGVEAQILERGIQIVTALTLLLGSGKEQGQTYEAASSYFKLAWENLKDATVADDSWSGTAADAYNARNAQQIELATILADLDLQVAALLQQNSDTLGICKVTLTGVRALYTVCVPIASAIRWWYGPAGVAMSITFQWAVLLIGLPIALSACVVAFSQAAENGASLTAITEGYTAAAASATVTGAEYAAPKQAPASKSMVSEFDQLSGAGSSAAVSGGFDELASLPTGAPSRSTGDTSYAGGIPKDESPGAPSGSAVPQTTGAPAYAAAGLGQVPSQPPGSRASSVSSAVSGAKGADARDAGVDKEVDKEDFTARDVQGAAAGAEAGESAPVDTAADGAKREREGVR
ncbi:EspA/EspE family type VII secretion system effector [Mycobacterium lentiflavum]|uniref:ESX-1 secretion-associated protein EspA/EspE-like domain-containing protein n=1 Tax=Mycobacterium lentiflavum TaxID=141349 RepID=A0ABY3UU38_MYCLN|nr:EspA/EspE family type VII secretion system effector [Mycobacterium lentiflavum]ULP40947.1 hypothetical protein MJO58_18765 [Mycobacterium lentiflavum]